MASTELPWQFLGRRVRPFALAAALATLFVAGSLLIRREDSGGALDDWTAPGLAVGILAALASLALFAGWWARGEKLMRFGLLVAAGVFGARAGFIFADTHNVFALSALLSCAWVVACGGAYLLETSSPRPPDER